MKLERTMSTTDYDYSEEYRTRMLVPDDIEPSEQDSDSLFYTDPAEDLPEADSDISPEPSANNPKDMNEPSVSMAETPRFSFFKRPVTNQNPCKEISLAQLYAYLTSDYAKDATEQLRAITDEDAAKAFKRTHFDYVTPAGVFSSRRADKIVTPSGLIVMDIDHLPGAAAVEDTFQLLLNVPLLETLLLFRSPSGRGLKWIVPVVNNEGHDHGFYFDSVSNYLKTFGIVVDPSGRDISRACFLPYDPKAFFNDKCRNSDQQSDFNPAAWQTSSGKPTSQLVAPRAESSVNTGDIACDVECVLQQIEEKHVDITNTYERWVRTGFAFADQFGEDGRTYFQRASQFYPDYSWTETDKQYDYCISSNREGVTIRTFFGYAQDAGIDLRTRSYKSPKPPVLPKSPRTDNGGIGESGESGETTGDGLPTFSEIVTSDLPEFLKTIASYGRNTKETDILLLSAITVISGCLHNVQGVYDDRIVYPTLFLFISARAGSGKGRIDLCRLLARPIHQRLKDDYDKRMAQYEIDLASSEGSAVKPKKPTQTKLFIPADSSATAFSQQLNDNGGRGIIYESEADALADSFESDFGNYSKSFRAAFHHETIAYHRRAGNEDVEIENPKLAVVLSGTRNQVSRLIGSVENGLCSRFAFYRLETELVWRSVLKNQGKVTMDDKFNELGEDFLKFYDSLCKQEVIHFEVTKEQSDNFDSYFSQLMSDYVRIFQEEILASVFRLGLICFRIAMVLTVLRMKDTGEVSEVIVCNDQDFKTALTISQVLAVHMAKVYDELTASECSRSSTVAKSAKRQRFLEALPEVFDRQGYLDAADKVGVPPSTAEKWIRTFCEEDGPLERVEHGRYRKR